MIVPERLRALIIDDNTYARVTTAASLNRLGVTQIQEAENGASAICMLRAAAFDVVFMDWYMPDISGGGLLQVMRDKRFGLAPDLPVILVTAYPTRETLSRARALGINEVLTKPFTSAIVANALGRVFADGWQPQEDDKRAAGDRFFL